MSSGSSCSMRCPENTLRQDVPAMLEKVFEILDSGDTSVRRIEIPPELIGSQSVTA